MTLVLIVILTLAWVAITGSVTVANLLLGLVISVAATGLLRRVFALPPLGRRLWAIAILTVLFLRELIVSAVRVSLVVLRPNLNSLRPAIIAFPLSVTSDAEITLLASLITLTPGTLSVDVSDDRSMLYVHVLDLKDRDGVVADIANGFEAKVRNIFL